MSASVLQARAALGVASRGTRDPEKIAEARRALAAAKIEAAIEKAVASAPPLTAAQRDRLASLLRPGAA